MTESETSRNRVVRTLVPIGIVLTAIVGLALIVYGLNLLGPAEPEAVAVRIESRPSPTRAGPGDVVTYVVMISNEAPRSDVEIRSVSDTLLGDLSATFSSRLSANESEQETFTRTVRAGDPDPLRNTVTVSIAAGDEVIEATATAEVDVLTPAVRVQASLTSEAAAPGEEIVYSVSLSNVGEATLEPITVTDSLDGDLSASFPSSLPPGASQGQAFDWAIPSDAGDSLTRTITVYAGIAGNVVSDTITVSLDLTRPAVQVEAGVMPTTTVRGGAATYTLTVVNAGSLDLRAVRVEDSFLGDVSRAFPDTLPAGTSHSQVYTWSSGPDDVGPLIRSVTASAESDGQPVSASATAALNLAGVAVSLAGPERAGAGEEVSLTGTVTNTSSAGAPSFVLDIIANTGRELTVPEACRILDEGEACSFSYDPVVPAGGEEFTNGVEARYRLEGGTQVATASAEHTLAVTTAWQQGTGMPDGAEIRALVVCPADPDVLYAGFGIQGRGVYRSRDGGRRWVGTALENENAEVYGLAVNADDCDTVYAGAWRGGVRKSDDGGRTWRRSPQGLEGAFVYNVAVDPRDGDVVYAGTAEKGVYRSDDGGATWRAWGLDALTVPHLSVASDGRMVFAATWGDGVHRRERSGVGWGAWSGVNDGIADEHREVYAVAVDPVDPSTVFAATASGGVYRTRDGGGAWEQVFRSPRTAYAVAGGPGGTVYAGTAEGIYRSGAGGEPGSWEAFDAGLEELAIRSLVLGPEGTFHLGTSNGAWRRLP